VYSFSGVLSINISLLTSSFVDFLKMALPVYAPESFSNPTKRQESCCIPLLSIGLGYGDCETAPAENKISRTLGSLTRFINSVSRNRRVRALLVVARIAAGIRAELMEIASIKMEAATATSEVSIFNDVTSTLPKIRMLVSLTPGLFLEINFISTGVANAYVIRDFAIKSVECWSTSEFRMLLSSIISEAESAIETELDSTKSAYLQVKS
jgi:hypothetical protein